MSLDSGYATLRYKRFTVDIGRWHAHTHQQQKHLLHVAIRPAQIDCCPIALLLFFLLLKLLVKLLLLAEIGGNFAKHLLGLLRSDVDRSA